MGSIHLGKRAVGWALMMHSTVQAVGTVAHTVVEEEKYERDRQERLMIWFTMMSSLLSVKVWGGRYDAPRGPKRGDEETKGQQYLEALRILCPQFSPGTKPSCKI
jgi:hypothetical protein